MPSCNEWGQARDGGQAALVPKAEEGDDVRGGGVRAAGHKDVERLGAKDSTPRVF